MEDDLEDMLLEIKDTSELMTDLAYSSLLYSNRDIADEVFIMHQRIRELVNDIQEEAVKRLIGDRETQKALAVIRLSSSVGDIADAAMKIADVVRRNPEQHPVIQLSLMDSDVIITTALVERGSDLAGSPLGSIKLASISGMWLIAIRRGRRYIYGPDATTLIIEGDLLFARGPIDGEEYFKELASGAVHLNGAT